MSLFLEGRYFGEEISLELSSGVFRVGREKHNDLRLGDPSVSRDHAEIQVDGARIMLRDLGSRNGTWVNGRKLLAPQLLESGDRIRFGGVELDIRDPRADTKGSGTALADPPVFSDAGEVSTSRRLQWDLARQDPNTLSSPERKMFRSLTEAGRLLVSHGSLEEVFEAVLDLVERTIEARRIVLLLRESDGEMPQVRAARPLSASRERILLSRKLVDAVLQGRESLRIVDAQLDARFQMQESIVNQDVRAALVAPLFDNERVLGLIYADTDNPRVIYDDDQLQVLSFLANLIGVKISTTRLLEDQRRKELMEQELNTAARIQSELLPSTLPEQPGYEFLAHQQSCHQVGGDLYDALHLPDGSLSIAVGDVCGKGMGAALLMSTVIASLRLLLDEGLSLLEVMPRLHRQVFRSTDPMRYVTLFLARLDPRTHMLEYVNAGHNPPLLLSQDGSIRELSPTGLPVGLLPDSPYESASVELHPGAILCIFSDGIPEADRDGELFGDDRIRASLLDRRNRPLEEAASGLMTDLADFLQGSPASDDITLFLLRRSWV